MSCKTTTDISLQPNTDAQDKANWPAVFALSFGLFSLVTTELLPIGLITPMAAGLGTSEGATGQAITATALIAAGAGPLLVLGSGRLDRQRLVWILGIVFCAASLACALATSLAALLAARALLGVALGGTWAMAIALTMRLVPKNRVPQALVVVFTGVSVANVIAAPLGAYIGEVLSWRAAFAISTLCACLALAGQILTLPKLPATLPPTITMFRTTLAHPAMVIGLVTVLFVLVGNTAGISFIRPFLETGPQLDGKTISVVLLIFGVAGFFGNLISGRISSVSAALGAGGGALVIAGATVVLAGHGTTLVVVVAAIAVWGFGIGAFPVAISSWSAQAVPDQGETAGALLSAGFQIAIAGGAVLGGVMIDGFGMTAPLYCAGFGTAVGACIMLALGRPSERQRNPH